MIQQVIQAGTAVFISLFIVGLLIVIDPFAAVAAAAGFALIYVLVSAFTRRRLAQNSEVMGSSYDERVKILQESLGGIRDVIIDGSQSVYLDAFRRVDDRFNAAKASTAFISAAPRFVIEALGMILIAALAIAISAREGGFAFALPILGALALRRPTAAAAIATDLSGLVARRGQRVPADSSPRAPVPAGGRGARQGSGGGSHCHSATASALST